MERAFAVASGLQQAGQWRQAEQLYLRILAIEPQHFAALFSLAAGRGQHGDGEAAGRLLAAAARAAPDSAAAQVRVGIALARLNRPAEAMACFAQALALRPDYADGHRSLADLLLSLGRYDKAVTHYHKALAIRADDAEVCNKLAFVLNQLGRAEEALAYAERALSIRPHYADAHSNLGNALMALNRDAEAITHYQKVLGIEPANAEAQNNIGVALQALGRLEQAARAYEQAVALAPRKPSIYLNLVHAQPLSIADSRLAALEALAQEVDTFSQEEQIALHFALGKALGDLKQPERSFHHLRLGNKLKRQQVDYNEAQTLDLFVRIQAAFGAALLRDKAGGGNPSSVPVFIVGMPRSGTTLIEQILASHSKVFGAGERQEFGDAVMALSKPGPAFPELVTNLTADALHALGSGYIAALSVAAPGAARIVDKMPTNFLYAGLIHLALPNARIIHSRRDPIDTCWSCFSLLFAGNQRHTYDLRELGRYYRAYEALMAHWRCLLPPGVMLEMRYEDIVDDLENSARAILAHCGLDWEGACLNFHETSRPVQTASSLQVRQPIYRSSVGRASLYRHLLQELEEGLSADPAIPGG